MPLPLVARHPPQARRSKRFPFFLFRLFHALCLSVYGCLSDAAAAWPDAITCGMPTPS